MTQMQNDSPTNKRKATLTPLERVHYKPETFQSLADAATEFSEALEKPISSDDLIVHCGSAPLHILASRPEDAIRLAQEKFYTWPYKNVPPCWCRLYEDASLHIAIKQLRAIKSQMEPVIDRSQRAIPRLDNMDLDSRIAEVVQTLDRAVVVAGAPGRQELIERGFRRLNAAFQTFAPPPSSRRLVEGPPPIEDIEHPIARAPRALSVDSFQRHMENSGQPLVIPHVFDHWHANQMWQNLAYLKEQTVGGRRLVPVEVGSSYTEDAWEQRIMTFNDFATRFLEPDEPAEIGYLAQHDLFHQIPALRSDISVPDYCQTTPMPPPQELVCTGDVIAEHFDTAPFLLEPSLNAWLGPRGTKTPLHTDPYHNLLCQVVGYKYVRLYAPATTPQMYPVGVDGAGINLNNTSRVDVWPLRRRRPSRTPADPDRARQLMEEFPLFAQARYQETVLAPGECLYIPLGWWHYVESLTTSFSVSFWWN